MKKVIKKLFLFPIFLLALFVFPSVSRANKNICDIILPVDKGVGWDSYGVSIFENDFGTRFMELRYSKYKETYLIGSVNSNDKVTIPSSFPKLNNLGSASGLSSYYSTDQIEKIGNGVSCPKYAWVGNKTGAGDTLGFVLSNTIVNKQKVGDYNNIYYDKQEDEASNSSDYKKLLKEYNNLYDKLSSLIEGHYAKKCSDLKNIYDDEERFDNLLKTLKDFASKNSSFKFDPKPGEKLHTNLQLAEKYCNTEDYDMEKKNGKIDSGEDVDACNVIPDVVKTWIINILKIIRYLALALVVVLGVLDFMKAAGSGEPDAMKKAGQSFGKRLIAVIVLFLLPYLVELLLGLVDLLGADPNCVDISSY